MGKHDSVNRNIFSFSSIDDAVDYYFNYYLETGYPNYSKCDYDPAKELEKLKKVDSFSILENKILKQTMHSCGFLFSYFPHWIDVSTVGGESLSDCWNDKDKLYTLIKKCVVWCVKHENGKMNTNRVRQLAKVYCAKQSPSNFRPTAAKCLYDMYGNGGYIYDPCAGWGGRLLGFLASNCKEYVCCDPSTKTVAGLNELRKTYEYVEDKKIEINEVCAEDFTPANNHFDMVFTSPPYFDTEHYCEEPTQSYIRYNTVSEWIDKFLYPLINSSYNCLKSGGHFLLNIANTKNATNLQEKSIEIASEIGFSFEDTLKLALSSISGKGTKYEPIFVFKK